jgi:hypothetical protein
MKFGPIRECIYCGNRSDKLSNEHIIAYGLGGTDILLNASCKKCQDITSKIELNVLHKELLQIRTKLDMPSRKSSLPENLSMVAVYDNKKEEIYLPKEKCPTFINFLEYPLPGVFGGDMPDHGINIIGVQLHQIGESLKETKEILKSLNTNEIESSHIHKGVEFEKMLAKIAYGYAVAQYGIDVVRQSPLRSIILGTSDVIGQYIGMGNFHPIYTNPFYRIKLEKNGNWLFARIYLLPNSPEYIVIILEGDSKDKPKIYQYTFSVETLEFKQTFLIQTYITCDKIANPDYISSASYYLSEPTSYID